MLHLRCRRTELLVKLPGAVVELLVELLGVLVELLNLGLLPPEDHAQEQQDQAHKDGDDDFHCHMSYSSIYY